MVYLFTFDCQGDDGDMGPIGEPGDPGESLIESPTPVKGMRGEPGDPGDPGQNCTVTMLDPDRKALIGPPGDRVSRFSD